MTIAEWCIFGTLLLYLLLSFPLGLTYFVALWRGVTSRV